MRVMGAADEIKPGVLHHGGQPLAGMHAEQAGVLPRKAEAAEQGLKRRDSRMVRKVVAGLAECGKRTAEAVIEGVPRG